MWLFFCADAHLKGGGFARLKCRSYPWLFGCPLISIGYQRYLVSHSGIPWSCFHHRFENNAQKYSSDFFNEGGGRAFRRSNLSFPTFGYDRRCIPPKACLHPGSTSLTYTQAGGPCYLSYQMELDSAGQIPYQHSTNKCYDRRRLPMHICTFRWMISYCLNRVVKMRASDVVLFQRVP